MTARYPAVLIAITIASFSVPTYAHAQVRASERGAVSQTIDGTTIALDYGRPAVRGRDESLFGGVVWWGKVWTPGANFATTLETNNDITVNGHELSAGKYSIWMEVQPEEWTVIFDPTPLRFHLIPPERADNQMRFSITPQESRHIERLTWSFPEMSPTSTTLLMQWGRTSVALDIGVKPSQPLTVAEDVAAPYLGSYHMTYAPGGPLGTGEAQFDLTYENSHLVGRWNPAPIPEIAEVWLVSLGEGMFTQALLSDGELFDVDLDVVYEFTSEDGSVTGFEVRIPVDALIVTAERIR